MVSPEEIRIMVLRSGILNGLKGEIPIGGHNCPISILGDRDEWKYAQKKDRKKNTSEVMNKIIPSRIPEYTIFECDPEKVASRITSRHHIIMQIRVHGIVRSNISLLIFCIHMIDPIRLLKILKEIKIGQGLIETRWNG